MKTIKVTLELTQKDIEVIEYFLLKPYHETAKVKLTSKLREWFGHIFEENKKCDDCGQVKPDVSTTFCPYAADVNNNPNVEITVCGDCYRERANDI